jgi:3-deoxy-D-manno-octulosonic-acid transferase
MRALAYILYNLAIFLCSPFIGAYFIARTWKRGAPLTGMAERLGFVRHLRPLENGERIWIHAVSVGEVGVAAALLPALLKKRPGLRIVLSTVTETGREEAERIDGVEYVFYLPFDYPFAVRSTFERIQPDALALVETELWPNLIWKAARQGVPVCVINGRLSEDSFRGYMRLRFLFAAALGKLAGVATRGEADADRFRALGAGGVFASGNIKYDAPPPELEEDPIELRRKFGLAGEEVVIVAGSTHPGEEEAVGAAVLKLLERLGGVGVLIAPRRLERLAEVEAELRRVGLSSIRWSELSSGTGGGAPESGQVVLLDVMGRLGEAYACATAAFIGGSLIPHGGQNPIEAARWGVPVVFGPHMKNFAEVADALLAAGGAVQVSGPEELGEALLPWLSDAAVRDAAGAAARESVMANRGAAARTANFLAGLLDSRRAAK